MKILCCNIRVDVPTDSETGNGWDDRKDYCLEVMRAQNADIICTQECRNGHYLYLKDRLTEYEFFGIANPDTAFHPTNAIFYAKDRFDLTTAGGFWLSETPHVAGSVSWDSARPRFVNFIELRERDSGREFRMWNGHFDHIGKVARVRQAQCLIEGTQVLPDDYPQFFTADCNTDASDPAIANIKIAGWTDTYTAIHGPEDPGFTYHAFVGSEFVPKNGIGKIDFIFCKGPVEVLDADIIRENRNGKYPSDHYFITAEVRF